MVGAFWFCPDALVGVPTLRRDTHLVFTLRTTFYELRTSFCPLFCSVQTAVFAACQASFEDECHFLSCARTRHTNRLSALRPEGLRTSNFGMNPRAGSPTRALFFVLALCRHRVRTISSSAVWRRLACSLWGFCHASLLRAFSSLQILDS